jgi:hypothetical protein
MSELRTRAAGDAKGAIPRIAVGASALLCATLFASAAVSQEASEDWTFRASVYGYFPDLASKAQLPVGSTEINVDAGDLLDHTDAAFMGVIEAQRGRLGAFADLMHFNLGNSITGSRQVSVGGGTPLPPGVTVDGSLDIKMWALTVAGNYRAHESPRAVVDVFAGARMLKVDADLDYAFNPGFGPFAGPASAGSVGASKEVWDAVAGVKGRVTFGADGQWFAHYYADVGGGDSKLTWQAFLGAGRRFGRYEVTAGWRRLDYDFDSKSRIRDLTFEGPVLGVSVNW